MPEAKHHRQGESGNVLIYILLAIGLLAALTYAVAQGGRTSTKGVNVERDKLLATEMIDYADVVKKAVTQLRLRGITVEQLEFNWPGSAGYDHGGCTTGACNIFDPAGGGVIYKAANPSALSAATDWVFTAVNEVDQVGKTCGGADCSDLMMVVAGVRDAICTEINAKLSVAGEGDPIPVETDIDVTVPYAGAAGYAETLGDEAASLVLAKMSGGCFNAGGVNYFYSVLLAR